MAALTGRDFHSGTKTLSISPVEPIDIAFDATEYVIEVSHPDGSNAIKSVFSIADWFTGPRFGLMKRHGLAFRLKAR